ncbi:MAG: hypothetical protein LBI92_06840 [Azoarcus sp.]|nr:hypothetical protein [Azoarcus sp.]
MSSDDDAPSLGSSAGSLIAVLDACLIDGFGDLPGAGWGKTFVGENDAAYRAPNGLRHYLHVVDTAGTYATVNGYKTFSEGVGGALFATAGTVFWGKCADAVAPGRQWIVAADDKRFLIFVVPTAAINVGFRAVGGFGELAAHHPDDTNASFLLGGAAAAAVLATEDAALNFNSGVIFGSGQQAAHMPGLYGTASAPGKYACSLNGLLYHTYSSGNILTLDALDMPADYVWSSRILMRNSAVALSSSANTADTFNNILMTRPRGYIPGLLVPMMEMLPSLFPFWTSLGNGQYVIPISSRRAYVLDTGEWEYQ